ncbi:hypothetical protein GX50_03168 [[Emmonsia] crescens]|uniref:Protein kinase domain-containing protein n=1 Tax=[Emmonsia] crescens TaxID=73230 RepID=A0A2B7ZKZ3_9EURO|nr:hypothetical protein GX50_03168 [Emmonsia crescens]
MVAVWETCRKYFEKRDQPKTQSVLPSPECSFEEEIQVMRRYEGMDDSGEEDKTVILSMVRAMLVSKPEEQATMESLMTSEWMVNWSKRAGPEL